MSKSKNEANETEVLKLRVTPMTQADLEATSAIDHRPNLTSALNQALRLYLSPHRHLFATMKNGADCHIDTPEDYAEMKRAYNSASDLYATLTRVEDNNRECHLNALRDVIRDYVVPQIKDGVYEYEKAHYKEIDDNDFMSFLPWLEIPGYSEPGEDKDDKEED